MKLPQSDQNSPGSDSMFETLPVHRDKGKNLGRIENVVDRDQVVVGMLEADIPGAIVDRLNAPEVK